MITSRNELLKNNRRTDRPTASHITLLSFYTPTLKRDSSYPTARRSGEAVCRRSDVPTDQSTGGPVGRPIGWVYTNSFLFAYIYSRVGKYLLRNVLIQFPTLGIADKAAAIFLSIRLATKDGLAYSYRSDRLTEANVSLHNAGNRGY